MSRFQGIDPGWATIIAAAITAVIGGLFLLLREILSKSLNSGSANALRRAATILIVFALILVGVAVAIVPAIIDGGRKSVTTLSNTLGFRSNPVTHNAQWQPYIEEYAHEIAGIEVVLVPAGCFMMGEDGEGGRQCFEPFYMSRYEVTNAQYGSAGVFSGDNRPREYVTWLEARNFAAQLGCRLPTEAEWEYAARGPDALLYPWGNEFVAENLVYKENSDSQTAVVGSRPAGVSWVGAFDMSGNVWEWTSSIFQSYPYNPVDGRESNDDTSSLRVLRGGSWYGSPVSNRAIYRYRSSPNEPIDDFGFRLNCGGVPMQDS